MIALLYCMNQRSAEIYVEQHFFEICNRLNKYEQYEKSNFPIQISACLFIQEVKVCNLI